MNADELKIILDKHKLWLAKEPGGECADLCDADLYRADLHGADLRCAVLSGADLRCAVLSGADLRWANLRWANLYGVDLCNADLREADLSWAELYGANLFEADLHGANLNGTNISSTNLDEIVASEDKGTVVESGRKDDGGKLRLDLIPPEAIEILGEIYTYGAAKYGANNWAKGIDESRLLAAARRHDLALAKGETHDPESGLSHAGQAAWNYLTLETLRKRSK